jgi:hypothetical protein
MEEEGIFCLRHRVQTGSGVPRTFHPVNSGSFSEGRVTGA